MQDLDYLILINEWANEVRAETFDRFLDHAKSYFEESRKMEAGAGASVITSKPANGYHFKTGQRTTFRGQVFLLLRLKIYLEFFTSVFRFVAILFVLTLETPYMCRHSAFFNWLAASVPGLVGTVEIRTSSADFHGFHKPHILKAPFRLFPLKF